jgi:serine/threonine protein kinase
VIRKNVKRRKAQPSESCKGAFEKEMATLRLLRTLSHPNIVPLLGSYTYNDEHNFLFPCFEMDLEHFLEQDVRFGEFSWNFTFHLALCGLASALEHTHNLHLREKENGLDFDAIGYHNDFRPANILVSKSTYILADFGLGGLKSAEAKSETPWKKGAGDYIAPECMDASFAHQRVGRAIDVWAFGCLVVDVMTYMERGPEGVRRFRESRLGEMRPGWQSTYFHDSSGQLKASVRRWLDELGNTSSSTKQILQIAFQALEPNPEVRPRISQIRRSLTIHVLRVLLSAVLEIFGVYVDAAEQQRSLPMQLWFEGERIRAFLGALSLDYDQGSHIFEDFKSYNACCGAMMAIFRRIESELDTKGTKNLSALRVEILHDRRGSFEEQIRVLVQKLWDLLPSAYARRAQATWFQSMQMDDMDRLSKIDAYLQSHYREDFADAGARAHMRAILLQMQNNPMTGATEFFHPREDLDRLESMGGHTYGVFKKRQRVLVEWMFYRPEREAVPPEERLFIMQLRAKDFGTDPKPNGLRILKCLGFVEQIDEQDRSHGYGFLYELPQEIDDREFMPPVALRQLLLQDVNLARQPPLRGKFQLAHSLALFFEEFYTVGCLHGTFNSNNVIFNHSPSTIFGSTHIWNQPYVVGFQKSRPDGQSWATEGPADDTSLQVYEHPDYRQNNRFVLEYDYYSLGLVLLEIGGWTPLQEWCKRKEYRTLDPKDFRKLLIKKYVPRLATTVGEVYRDAVCTCLDGTLERDRKSSPSVGLDKEVFNMFTEKVAKPLEELSLLRI